MGTYTATRDSIISFLESDASDTTNGQLGQVRQSIISSAIGEGQWSTVTVAPRIPKDQQDYEGYVISVFLSNTALPLGERRTGIWNETQVWLIEMRSPQVTTGLRALQEDYILDYGNAMTQAILNDTTLGGTTGLFGITTFTTQWLAEPYPTNQEITVRNVFRITLTMTYQRTRC